MRMIFLIHFLFARLSLPWNMELPVKTLLVCVMLILHAVRLSGRLTWPLGQGRQSTTCKVTSNVIDNRLCRDVEICIVKIDDYMIFISINW